MTSFVRAVALVVCLTATAVWAQPRILTPDFFRETPGEALWRNVYKVITGNMEWLARKFNDGKSFRAGSREEQCLRIRMTMWHLDKTGGYMQGGDYNQIAVAMIRTVLRNNDDWCGPDGGGSQNQGLEVFNKFQASLTPAAERMVDEEVMGQLREGRKLTVAQVMAVIAAALISAPLLAPL